MQVGILGLLILIALSYWYTKNTNESSPLSPTVSNSAETEVRKLVTAFGTKLQMVSLVAPTDARRATMMEHYSPYISPELIEAWAKDNAAALGRSTSSPWPERIDIVEVRRTGDQFVVEGNIIEVMNEEAGTGKAVVAVLPVTLMLEERSGAWLIVGAMKGTYSELPKHETIIGYTECLPHKNTQREQTLECAIGIKVANSEDR